MRLTVRMKKFIALFLVVSVVLPLISSFDVFDRADVSAAGDVAGVSVDNDILMQAIVDSGVPSNLTVTEKGDIITSSMDAIDLIKADLQATNWAKDVVKADVTNNVVGEEDFKYGYDFNISFDTYNYDFFKSFTFLDDEGNDKVYTGVYNDKIKTDPEANLFSTIEDIGTLDKPYIIVEVVPESTLSAVRPHIGDQGYFDFTNEQLEALEEQELTYEESTVVRMQLLYQVTREEDERRIAEINARTDLTYQEKQERIAEETIQVRTSVAVRDADETVLDELLQLEDKMFMLGHGYYSKDAYMEYLDFKLQSAKDYKVKYMRSMQCRPIYNEGNYKPTVDFISTYAVDENGNFKTYQDEEATGNLTKKYVTTGQYLGSSADDGVTTNAFDDEIALTTTIYNPFALAYNATSPGVRVKTDTLFEPSYIFAKGCLDLAYNSIKDSDGKVDKQVPYVDEYIFSGWYVKDEEKNTLVKLTEDTDLSDVTHLYTSWVVRYYESDEYKFTTIPPSMADDQTVQVKFDGTDSYIVHLPITIASCNSSSDGYHDPRNQLSMCIPIKTKRLLINQGNVTLEDSTRGNIYYNPIGEYDTSYTEEYSSWDFDFSKSKYSTGADLMNVAPKLMADTDYYVKTYNAVTMEDENGDMLIEYYPYSVQVITTTPEELNKLVYADYADNGWDAGKYYGSPSANNFLNNADFIYFSGNGSSYYYSIEAEKLLYRDLVTGTDKTMNLAPAPGRLPAEFYIDEANDATGNLTLTYVSSDGSYSIQKQYKRAKAKEGVTTLVPVGDVFGTESDSPEKETKVVKSGSWGNDLRDMEWQLAYKIYLRAATPVVTSDEKGKYSNIDHQGRRIAIIFNEAFTDSGAVFGSGNKELKVQNSDGSYSYTSEGNEHNLAKMVYLFFQAVDPTLIYDMYVRDRDELKILANDSSVISSISYEVMYDCNFQTIKSDVRGETGDAGIVSSGGTRYTGYLYGYEKWNATLFFPYEMFTDIIPGLDHTLALTRFSSGKCQMDEIHPNIGTTTWGYYQDLRISRYTAYKGIANPYAYTFNGGTSLDSSFFKPDISRVESPTNGQPDGGQNTVLAFDYFKSVGRDDEIKIVNGEEKLATKSAIEFMVQNSQNGIVNYMDRHIEILNDDYAEKYRAISGETIKVDTVVVDDFSKPTWNINYVFSTTSVDRYYVVDYLWTKQYKKVDNENRFGKLWYGMYTTSTNEDIKWYTMPKSSKTSDVDNYFKTKLLKSQIVVDDNGNEREEDVLTDEVREYITPDTKYYFDALILPNVMAQASDATYMIAIKQYESKKAYDAGKDYVSVTLKNVALDRMSHMFQLD